MMIATVKIAKSKLLLGKDDGSDIRIIFFKKEQTKEDARVSRK